MEHTQFTTCINCGKYINPDPLSASGLCSASCAQLYTRCYNCGKYFIPEQDLTKKVEKKLPHYCSKECSIVYNYKKRIIRKYNSRMYWL